MCVTHTHTSKTHLLFFFLEVTTVTGNVGQLVEYLYSIQKGFELWHCKMSGVAALACDPNISEVEGRGPGVQGHSWLHSELQASLGYMKPCLKTNIHLSIFINTWLMNMHISEVHPAS